MTDEIDPDLAFFSADDLRKMHSLGMVLGGHTRSHDNLTACDAAELQSEIVDSADQLSELSGAPIRFFSYPDGRYNEAAVRVARGRFDAAFTIESKYTAPDLWRFPRRSGDDFADVRQVLSPWFPAKRRAIDAAKRVLKF